jgi:hypothetical protein
MADLVVQDSASTHVPDNATLVVNLVVADAYHVQSPDKVWYWETNFSEYALGAPGDWTERWATGDAAPSIVNSGPSGTIYGGQALKIDHSAADRYALSWNDIGSQGDVEILARVQYTGSAQDGQLRSIIRGAGGDGTEFSYHCDYGGGSSIWYVYKYNNGAATQIGSNISKPASAGTWYWTRFRVIGTSPAAIKFKVWETGTSEPSWDLEQTDSDLSSGWVGVGSYRGDTNFFDWIGIAVGGDTVPCPEIAVNDSAHIQVPDNTPLVVVLEPAETNHVQAVDENINFPVYARADDVVQLQALEGDLILQVSITVANTYHAHASPQAGLVVILSPDELHHVQSPENIGIFQIHLNTFNSFHANVPDNCSIGPHIVLVPTGYYPAAISHVQYPDDDLVLVETQIPVVASATVHLQASDNIELTPLLNVDDIAHVQVSDSPGLTEIFTIHIPFGPYHVQATGAVLSPLLTVSDGTHLQVADGTIDIDSVRTLAVDDSAHTQVVGTTDVSPTLVVSDVVHFNAVTSAGKLIQTHYLKIAGGIEDSVHVQAVDNIAIVALPADLIFLTITKYAA